MKKATIIHCITWLLRLTVGATFIFSGFVKAIDPWGTLYKFQDYVGVVGWSLPTNLLITGVFLLCAYEFIVGIFLLVGGFRRSAPIGAALLMCFMLPLTLWIAIKDPVTDCGCFGDALIISNWATFWKNVALTAAIVWLIRFNTQSRCIIRPYTQWIALLFSLGFILTISFAGYIYQPLIDFRPFPIGAHLSEAAPIEEDELNEEGEDEEQEMTFVYAKDGVEKRFSIDDDLPDEAEGWEFVRREYAKENKYTPSESDAAKAKEDKEGLHIWDEAGDEEVTDDVITDKGGQFLLLMPAIGDVSIATTWQINSLYHWASEKGVDMIAVVAGSEAEIERWKDLSLAEYPIYKAEDTQIKMLARGNPAIVYLKDGEIVWKSTLKALYTEDFQLQDTLSSTPESFARDNHRLLCNAIGIYVILMAILAFFSYLPALGRFFPTKMRTRIARRDEKIKDAENRQLKKAEERLHIPKHRMPKDK